jgi:hypothetical protein
MSVEFEQIVNAPNLYINGLLISNDVTTPNTVLDYAAGACRDSSNQADIVLSAGSVNFGVNGLNGLDTGSIAASKMYYLYAVSDPTGFRPSGVIASLTSPLNSGVPLMPFGYGLYRYIGAWASNGSSDLVVGYMSGANSNERWFFYDAITATPLTAGHATSFTSVDLINLVPAVANCKVEFYVAYTPATAGNQAAFRPQGSSSSAGQHLVTGQVATVIVDQKVELLTELNSSNHPEIQYKVGNASDALALSIEGYWVGV